MIQEKKKVIMYRYCPHPVFNEGYYELKTTDGEFLGNIDPEELQEELRFYQKIGYLISRSV